jgi:hypothetical protein
MIISYNFILVALFKPIKLNRKIFITNGWEEARMVGENYFVFKVRKGEEAIWILYCEVGVFCFESHESRSNFLQATGFEPRPTLLLLDVPDFLKIARKDPILKNVDNWDVLSTETLM